MPRDSNDRNQLSKSDFVENFLNNKFPFHSGMDQEILKDTSWIEGYVQDILHNAVPKARRTSPQKIPSQTFETHQYVIVKLTIPSHIDPGTLMISIGTNLVKIEGLTSSATIVKLPCTVVQNSARATFKDGILQIKMRKKTMKQGYHHVNIRFL